MPGLDGYAVCAQIRADATLAAVPVISTLLFLDGRDLVAIQLLGHCFLSGSWATPAGSTTHGVAMLLRFAAHVLPAELLEEGVAPAGSTRRDH